MGGGHFAGLNLAGAGLGTMTGGTVGLYDMYSRNSDRPFHW